jgi:hypothetical protein
MKKLRGNCYNLLKEPSQNLSGRNEGKASYLIDTGSYFSGGKGAGAFS